MTSQRKVVGGTSEETVIPHGAAFFYSVSSPRMASYPDMDRKQTKRKKGDIENSPVVETDWQQNCHSVDFMNNSAATLLTIDEVIARNNDILQWCLESADCPNAITRNNSIAEHITAAVKNQIGQPDTRGVSKKAKKVSKVPDSGLSNVFRQPATPQPEKSTSDGKTVSSVPNTPTEKSTLKADEDNRCFAASFGGNKQEMTQQTATPPTVPNTNRYPNSGQIITSFWNKNYLNGLRTVKQGLTQQVVTPTTVPDPNRYENTEQMITNFWHRHLDTSLNGLQTMVQSMGPLIATPPTIARTDGYSNSEQTITIVPREEPLNTSQHGHRTVKQIVDEHLSSAPELSPIAPIENQLRCPSNASYYSTNQTPIPREETTMPTDTTNPCGTPSELVLNDDIYYYH